MIPLYMQGEGYEDKKQKETNIENDDHSQSNERMAPDYFKHDLFLVKKAGNIITTKKYD